MAGTSASDSVHPCFHLAIEEDKQPSLKCSRNMKWGIAKRNQQRRPWVRRCTSAGPEHTLDPRTHPCAVVINVTSGWSRQPSAWHRSWVPRQLSAQDIPHTLHKHLMKTCHWPTAGLGVYSSDTYQEQDSNVPSLKGLEKPGCVVPTMSDTSELGQG